MEETKVDVVLGSDNIFDDLGFEPEEATNLRIRSDLMLDLRSHIQQKGWSHEETAKFLDEPQTTIRNLADGEIDEFTVDRLIQLLGKVGMTVEVKVITNAA